MDEKIVKELKGFSGSKIYLMETDHLFVRKIGNVERNYERLDFLHKNRYNVPKIYSYDGNYLDMEYIHGLDIKTYLQKNSIQQLRDFIFNLFDSFIENCIAKDYTSVYNDKLQWIDEVDHEAHLIFLCLMHKHFE